ncbi:MAG: hypothetical protein A2638_01040 [Nitrospirae bacterium RIFCSPHIGHO2_01_FULL_66_17]|nr:MAG: hypothetical protein A2638_01040 [Nitrospirae bacterium RIFCSPHIGHO2_01_FULL_66_17]
MTNRGLIGLLLAIGIVWQVGTLAVLGADEGAASPEAPPDSVAEPSEALPEEAQPGAVTPSAIEGPSDTSALQGPPPSTVVDAIRDDLDIVGEVVGASSGRVIFAAGDVVSLRVKSLIDPKPGLTLAVVRPEQRVKHPRSHRTMGRVVRAVGTVELREAFGKFWSARVVRSSDAVSVGDLVISVGADEAAEGVSASAEDGGYIVAVSIQKALTGAYEVVYTDLGRNHGVQSGHVFSIIREGTRGRQGGPARKIGEGRVVAVQPSSSSFFVTRSDEPVQVGDRLERVAADAAP